MYAGEGALQRSVKESRHWLRALALAMPCNVSPPGLGFDG
jgi:hypothetical protein